MITLQQKSTISYIIRISKLNGILAKKCNILRIFFSIWEPSLDLSFDEDEAKSFVEEARDLTDRVTQVEKSFGSKSLETITLPKPLEDYTWLAFAKTVTHLHKYLADKGMVIYFFIIIYSLE